MVHEKLKEKLLALAASNAGAGGDWLEACGELLSALGYSSDRVPPGQENTAKSFVEQFGAENPNTQSEQRFLSEVKHARILFQVTDDEIVAAAQRSLLKPEGSFAKGYLKSFLFTAVQLKSRSHSRRRYVELAREINKRLRMPAVVIFRTASGLLSLAFVHRRLNMRDSGRMVLGRVALIREIDPHEPHRAHLDILSDLALSDRLEWMAQHGKDQNFDGLRAAWLDALDTDALNRRFYRELFQWFERAKRVARFPHGGKESLGREEHLIRLITRLLFVWFIKEKGLVAEELFVEHEVGRFLKNYDRMEGDSYYRAVLQNLFFATLNTEIGKRKFSGGHQPDHRNFCVYRYRDEIAEEDRLMTLLAKTPFVNGGLFECLDSFDSRSQGGQRVDCFTDNPDQRKGYSIPNRLFFSDDPDMGLINLLNHYKFTVEENTPVDQEVALDPELLGKVFENLLAAMVPETQQTARKQTGSYYTPRLVVDYMVDEALAQAIAFRKAPQGKDRNWWSERLVYLMDYADACEDAEELFEQEEREWLVRTISELRILDPAVGSGAFPMAMLHKLTLALRRIDPENKLWRQLQKEKALERADAVFDVPKPFDRDQLLQEINDNFERYKGSDFGRKLYLIQNSIFGIDIQPVAIQIAKLRFFISLAIEQQPDGDRNANYGIKPLPNLETRFVIADTLLSLSPTAQADLASHDLTELQRDLAANREKYFHATDRNQKLAFRNEDRRLREAIESEMRLAALPPKAARKVAQWDPYDQNALADWFDAKYMFGVSDGFDVVVGNPPYIQLQKESGKVGKRYGDAGYKTFARTGDIYQLFYERGCEMLKPNEGVLAYITSNSWLKANYGKRLRQLFSGDHSPLRLIEMGKDVFENAIVDSAVLILLKGKDHSVTCKAVDMDEASGDCFPPPPRDWGTLQQEGDRPWMALSSVERSLMKKIEAIGTPLKDWDISIYRGILTGYNAAFIVNRETRESLVSADPKSAELLKPILRGRDIARYRANWADYYLISTFPALGLDIDEYPAIKRHLLSFGKGRLAQEGCQLPGGGGDQERRPQIHGTNFRILALTMRNLESPSCFG